MNGSVRTLDRKGKRRSLQDIQARRRQLVNLMFLVFIVVVGALVAFSFASELFLEQELELLNTDMLRLFLGLLAGMFVIYIWSKDRELNRAETALVDAEIRSTALANRLRELSALAQAGKAVSSVLSLEDVLQVILESARDLLGATEGSVMLLDDDKRNLTVAASVGIDAEVAKDTVVPVGDGVAGWVAEFREPVILQGNPPADRFKGFVPKDRKVRSAMSAPLYARAEPVGVLNVSVSNGGREYTEEDLRSLTVFAEHAAIAIANARLYEGEKMARERLAEVDERRREFVANLTHDLKTPLTSILGYVRLLKAEGETITKEQARGFMDVIDRQGRRILEMIERLVVASQLEEGHPPLSRARLDLRRLLEEQVEAFQGVRGGGQIDLRIPDDLPEVFGDPSAVEHIVANLLDNAIKYSPQGSAIKIDVRYTPGEIQVSILDEGPGIAEDLLAHVFERYRRATTEGAASSVGLGLFIVRSLIQAHGGRAWAENRPEGGARMNFTLPVRRR